MSTGTDTQAAEPTPSTRVELTEGRRVVTGLLFRVPSRTGVRLRTEAPPPPPPSPPAVRRPSRVARMLAFAHRIEAAIARGEFPDRAEAARQLGVTRARMTQLMDLMLLAPDLQEELLFSEAVDGLEPVTERGLRAVLVAVEWTEQRRRWGAVRRHATGERSKLVGAR
jgi:hypothetical protein